MLEMLNLEIIELSLENLFADFAMPTAFHAQTTQLIHAVLVLMAII